MTEIDVSDSDLLWMRLILYFYIRKARTDYTYLSHTALQGEQASSFLQAAEGRQRGGGVEESLRLPHQLLGHRDGSGPVEGRVPGHEDGEWGAGATEGVPPHNIISPHSDPGGELLEEGNLRHGLTVRDGNNVIFFNYFWGRRIVGKIPTNDPTVLPLLESVDVEGWGSGIRAAGAKIKRCFESHSETTKMTQT